MESLTKLKHTHTVAAYKGQFEFISNRIRNFSDMHKLSCFMSGLKDEVRLAVKMQGPRNLGEAYALAKIQEGYLVTVKRSSRPTYEQNRGNWSHPNPQQDTAETEFKGSEPKQLSTRPPLAVQKLTPMQMSKRRKKGLCYHCDEKWSVGHKCKSMKLYLIEEVQEEDGDCVIVEEEKEEMELREEAEITLCALLGSTSPSIMRVIAIINGQKAVVLIDIGNSHNFMDKSLAASLKLQVDSESCFGVKVANGQIIKTKGDCKALKFKIQGLQLEVNFSLLDLGGCGIVLGTQWLSTLGVISWNFKKLLMGFMVNGKQIWLQGIKATDSVIQGSKKFQGKAAKGLLLQILPFELAAIQEPIEPPMQELLGKFPQVFEEPKRLPPKRGHEHQIILKEGVSSHCQRPYRYPYYQKTKIEKIVKDLLDSGCVRPSQSPFASPILLVRKANGSWRICVDYRGLNKATVKDKFPIPIVNELLDELQGANVFSKLDLRSDYHQIKMRKQDIEKTAFKTHEGHYEYLVMHFGLTNAPSTFQALMNEVFRTHFEEVCAGFV